MKHLPSMKQLQYLIALYDTESFSRAAEKCFVTQSTLSAGIAALEEIINQPVVDRSYRKVVFTPLGRELIDQARIIIESADQIVQRGKSLSAPLSGPLRMGIIPTIAPYILPIILPASHKEFPALELQINEEQSHRVVEDIKTGSLDCAILALPYDTENLATHELFQESFIVATAKNSWTHQKPVKYPDIAEEKLLLLEDGHCLRDHILEACRIPHPKHDKTLSATSLPTLLQMVRHGYGITLVPQMAVQSCKEFSDLDLIPLADEKPGRRIAMIWRKNHGQADEFKQLSDFIGELCKKSLIN